jgi:hypothetical protein
MTATTLFGVPWYVWGLLCLVVAAVYLVIWPRSSRKAGAPPRPRWRQFVLRWSHSLVWLLLAASCFVQAGQFASGAAIGGALALLAGLTYLLFMGTLVADLLVRR